VNQPPDRVYLQDAADYTETTWCWHPIDDTDVEYVPMSEYNQLQAEVERRRTEFETAIQRLIEQEGKTREANAEMNRLRSGLVKVDPWQYLGNYEMRCRFCGNMPNYDPSMDPENEQEWHKPDCIWLQAKLTEGGEE
jgi:hypothetical protein